jgi:hypothetical protein
MTLYAIFIPIIIPLMTHWTIVFPIFPIMPHYFPLFFLLFSIMTGCRHPENGNVQTANIDSLTRNYRLVSMENARYARLPVDAVKRMKTA